MDAAVVVDEAMVVDEVVAVMEVEAATAGEEEILRVEAAEEIRAVALGGLWPRRKNF